MIYPLMSIHSSVYRALIHSSKGPQLFSQEDLEKTLGRVKKKKKKKEQKKKKAAKKGSTALASLAK